MNEEKDKVQKVGQSLPIKSTEEMQQLGALFERSGMFGCKQQGQGTVLVMSCLMSGTNPLEFIGKYHLVEGRPTMRADAMLAAFAERGGEYRIIQRDAEKAGVWMKAGKREGTFSFTFEEAKNEPFIYQKDGKSYKHNWSSPRSRMQMLWARVVSDGVRTIDPAAVQGNYTPEEVQDLEPAQAKAPEYTPPQGMTGKPKPEPTEQEHNPGEPQDAELVEEVDYTVVPAGPNQGKKWEKYETKELEKFVQLRNKHMGDGHRMAIQRVLQKRKAWAEAVTKSPKQGQKKEQSKKKEQSNG